MLKELHLFLKHHKILYNWMFQKVLLALTIVGAVNWGLIGLFDFDLVAFIFGNMSLFTRVVYTVVAVCGLVNIGILFNHLETK